MANKKYVAAGLIPQTEHHDRAQSKRVTGDVLVPGNVISDNISSAPVKVGKDNLLRIRVTGTTYIAFADDPGDLGTISITTTPALELFSSGVYLVNATGEYIKGSAAVARLEVLFE